MPVWQEEGAVKVVVRGTREDVFVVEDDDLELEEAVTAAMTGNWMVP
jgi:hypothetical protein